MAKQCLIQKNKRIFKNSKINFLNNKKKKTELKKNFSLILFFKIQNINKNKIINRFKNRCYISGRSRSFYNRFNLNRNFIRKIGLFGYISGLHKSSW